jgi:hypothetical protein
MTLFPGWPYAAKAIIQHEFDTDHLNIWLTFSLAMDILVKPPNTLWLVTVGDFLTPVSYSEWQDPWTLLLTVLDIVALPARVLVAYDGPHVNLRRSTNPRYAGEDVKYNKQWEPWGPILSMDVGS